MKEIKMVVVGEYACAVKLGRCPMFAIDKKTNSEIWLPDCVKTIQIVK